MIQLQHYDSEVSNLHRIRLGSVCPSRPSENCSPSEVSKNVISAFDGVLADGAEFVLTPECFDISQGLDAAGLRAYCALRGDGVLQTLQKLARDNGICIGYCTYRTQGDGLVNSLRFIDADGQIAGEYMKNHPMIGEVENYGVPYGREATPIETKVGKIGGLICFDLNFEDIETAYKSAKPDLLAFSSVFHGGLMQARLAFNCRTHLLTSVGGMEASLLDPLGRVLAVSSNYTNYLTCEVNTDCAVVHLDYNAPKLREAKRILGRGITVSDPGKLGCVLISSESPDFDCKQILTRFEIEQYDDYLARAQAHRKRWLQ